MFQQVPKLRTDETKHAWQVKVPAWNVLPHKTTHCRVKSFKAT
jgi:hypothetical protein